MKKGLKTNPFDIMKVHEEKNNRREYPLYPAIEDIYNKFKEEKNLDPENISRTKTSVRNDNEESDREQDLSNHFPGSDLDIPGSEMDNEQEMTGNEDEENSYYSLGGDDHNDLDEDRDDL